MPDPQQQTPSATTQRIREAGTALREAVSAGRTTPATTAKSSATEPPNAEAAAKMYGDDSAPAGKMFHPNTPAMNVIDQRGPELWAETGAGAKDQQQLRETVRTIERTGLPDALVAKIADRHFSGLIGDARLPDDVAADERRLAIAQRIVENNARLREEFITRYGEKDGPARLARVQKFVNAHPALAKVLKQHGLGSDPEIVEGIAAHVFSSGWR